MCARIGGQRGRRGSHASPSLSIAEIGASRGVRVVRPEEFMARQDNC